MTSENHEVGILVKIRDRLRFNRDASDTARDVEKIGRSARQTGQHVKASGAEMRTYATGLGYLGGMAAGAGRQLGYVATGLVGAATAGTLYGLKTASGIEQANIAYRTMLGSQEAATSKIKELQAFAQETPFEFTGLITTGQQLMALGFASEEVIPTLRAVGDAASGLSLGQDGVSRITYALGQIKSAGRVMGPEIRQLSEAGIDALGMLAEAAGKTKAQVQADISAGLVPGEQAVQVLLRGMERRFGGLMEDQSKTLGGRWSNFVDKLKADLLSIDEQGQYGGALGPLVLMLERNMPRATELAGRGMAKLGDGVLWATDAISTLARRYKAGGAEGVLMELGHMTGTGDKLWRIWRRLNPLLDDTGSILKNSVVPGLRDTAIIVGPAFLAAFKILEGTLAWMADHPDAASAVFTLLGSALVTWAIATSILKVVGGFNAMRAAIIGVVEAYAMLGASGALGGAGGIPPVVAAPGGKGKGKGGGVGGVIGKIAKGTGVAWLAYEGGQAIDNWIRPADEHPQREEGGWKLSDFLGFSSGGYNSTGGVRRVGEEGPELVRLPGGAAVMNNSDMRRALQPTQGGGAPNVYVTIEAADYLNGRKVADLVVREIQTKLARS